MSASTDSQAPRGIAVVDVGYTNCKVILFDGSLKILGERKIASPHHDGRHYREIDVTAIISFAAVALRELDGILPVDRIVASAHGACMVGLKADGSLALPVMDYMSEPPTDIVTAYSKVMPGFAESYSPLLPMALLHGLQLFWQQQTLPEEFAAIKTLLPLMQYVGHALGGRPATEVSSMSCQTHLVDMRTGGPSSLAVAMGWQRLFAPMAKAWEVIGTLKPALRGANFRGKAEIAGGVHDSNANFLRYLAGGQTHFTLLSTGTWIIGFDTDADITALDHTRDIVANKNVFGKTVASCRFFGGKEFEVLGQGASGDDARLDIAGQMIMRGTFALPSFSDGGGPVPNTADKGRMTGPAPQSPAERATLASLYCALMVSESLDAIQSRANIIVDGPFSQNHVFLALLAALRPTQKVMASEERDGTAAGAACLGLNSNQSDGLLPHIDIALREIAPAAIAIAAYQAQWRKQSTGE